MARRNEIQGVCNDLLDSFVSRYNDIDGYWALGKFQTYMQSNVAHELCFDLVGRSDTVRKHPFSQTSRYYSGALRRHLKVRTIPLSWVNQGKITIRAASSKELECCIEVVTDLGKVFTSRRDVTAQPYNPKLEQRSSGKFGPKNQKGE